MHAHVHLNSGAGDAPADRAGLEPSPSGGGGQRRLLPRLRLKRLRGREPLTHSMMHLVMAIRVAYALTRDWRIALGVGVIEPMVAYMLHEKAWSRAAKPKA